MKPFIVYWNNIPAPYMVERFNALADLDNIEFEAWFNDRLDTGRSWDVNESNWRFRYRYLPTFKITSRNFHWPIPIFGRRPDVLVSLYAEPVFLVGWAIAKIRGSKTAFWCQVTNDKWVQRKLWKEKLKKIIFPKLDATLGSGEESRQFAIRYGVSENKALCLKHSIDIEYFASKHKQYYPQRENIKKQLGVRGTVFIYVGRLWWGKGLNYLLKAFKKVQCQCTEKVSLILIGDGPETGTLKQQCIDQGIHNVSFAGFHQKPELPKFYAISDVFVFPTLGDPYGLVVDEAMACSLPIISTSAAGEISDRIKEGLNGYIIPPENSEMLAKRMIQFVKNPRLSLSMGKKSSEIIAGQTPEQWATDFNKFIHSLTKVG